MKNNASASEFIAGGAAPGEMRRYSPLDTSCDGQAGHLWTRRVQRSAGGPWLISGRVFLPAGQPSCASVMAQVDAVLDAPCPADADTLPAPAMRG